MPHCFRRERRFLSGFDFWPFLKGATCGDCGLNLPVQTVQEIAEQYARCRRQHRKVRLRWRKSRGARRSLGCIPFKVKTIRYRGGQVYFAGRWLSLWDSFGQRFYRDLEPKLARAQRARKRSRTRAIHAKTGQAKSVPDAGWSTFRTMLRYKCDDAGVWFEEVNEAFSTPNSHPPISAMATVPSPMPCTGRNWKPPPPLAPRTSSTFWLSSWSRMSTTASPLRP